MIRTEEQKAYNLTIPGWLMDGDIDALVKLASHINKGTIIEIGSMHGKSAYAMATASNSTIYCLDFWYGNDVISEDKIWRKNSLEVFSSFIMECKNIIPKQIAMETEGKLDWNMPIDMVFIDASHHNPNDWDLIEYWLPKIKKGGILCGHDYYTIEKHGIVHYPDINDNVRKLEERFGRPVSTFKDSCIWCFIVS